MPDEMVSALPLLAVRVGARRKLRAGVGGLRLLGISFTCPHPPCSRGEGSRLGRVFALCMI